MKKRNAALSWITIVMILLLLFLLFASFALLWGRIFAPSMPCSFITRIWQGIRDFRYAKGVMHWLRQLPYYDACCQAARDAEGSMEPLKYVLQLMGCISLAVGSINEVKSTRSFGMLMSDVVHFTFPFHLCIQVPLYALFTVTGYYACLKNVGIAASFCLLGMVICFVYSLIMAWCLVVSQKAKEHLVTFYIKKVMISGLRHYEDIVDWQKTAGACVLDYARYISQQWTKGNILQIQKNNKWAQEELLIKFATLRLTGDTIWLNEKFELNSTKNDLRVPREFHELFPDSEYYKKEGAEYVLFTKAIYFMGDKDVNQLELDIRRCSQIWEQLFSQIESEKRKAQLAYVVLWKATASNWHIFTMMMLGLLVYWGVVKKTYVDSDGEQNFENKIAFLHNIRVCASEAIPEENLNECGNFNDNWAEMMYLIAGIIQWMLSMNCIARDVGDMLVRDLLKAISMCMSDRGFAHLKQDCEKYIVLSYLLFAFENVDIQRNMSAYIIQYLLPDVYTKLNGFEIK